MSSSAFSDPARHSTTLRELEVLRALIEHGTATAAADRLGISQPAVSRAAAQLETRLGRKLFEREGGRLIPTAEAHAIDAELDTVFSALARIEGTAPPLPDSQLPLRVAAPPTIAHRFLPGPVAAFARLYPEHQVLIDVLSSDVLVTHVAEGRVDMGIADSDPNHAGVRLETFRRSDVVCLMRRDDPMAAKPVITPADLEGRAFVSQTRRHSARAAKDGVLMAANVRPRITMEVATVVLAAELVREGLGLALINPFPTALRLDGALCMRPFLPRITLGTSFMTPVGTRPSAAALAFMALVRAAAETSHEGSPDDPPHART